MARARSTQSCMVTSRIGTSGMTSTAPMRGWLPRWMRRSIRSTHAATSASMAARTSSGSPASVRTLRLWSGSEERSRTRAGLAPRTAATIASITSARRPSLKFGTLSTIGMASASRGRGTVATGAREGVARQRLDQPQRIPAEHALPVGRQALGRRLRRPALERREVAALLGCALRLEAAPGDLEDAVEEVAGGRRPARRTPGQRGLPAQAADIVEEDQARLEAPGADEVPRRGRGNGVVEDALPQGRERDGGGRVAGIGAAHLDVVLQPDLREKGREVQLEVGHARDVAPE